MIKRNIVLFGSLAALIWGCGGGGSSSPSFSSTGTARVFVTDAIDTNAQVWVKIYKLTLTTESGPKTIFDDAAGKEIDVRALHDSSGQLFSLLNSATIPVGAYTGATFTVDKSITVFAPGATTGTVKTLPDDGTGHATIPVTFTPAINVTASTTDVVFDFDLAQWVEHGGVVTPVVNHNHDNTGLHDKNRHHDEDYEGTVASLSGTPPTQTFTINHAGGTINVTTDGTTTISTQSGTASPSLANGNRVEVAGTFDTASNTLAATSIKIEDEPGHEHDARLRGLTSTPDATAGTFVLTTLHVEHFSPMTSAYIVATDSNTVFTDASGTVVTSAAFFAILATASPVEVEGTIDSATGQFLATKARIAHGEDGHGGSGGDHGGNIEVGGAPTSINATTGTFSVTLAEWSGFSGTRGQVVNVTVDAAARFKGTGGTITKDAFFTQLAASGARVSVHGNWTPPSGLTGLELEVRSHGN